MKTEIKSIDHDCYFCDDIANAKMVVGEREIETCKNCAQKLFWELAHADYQFED